MRFLVLLHVAGNALVLWLGYYWLGVGETRAATLLWSALVVLIGICLACWLHGGTLAYFAAADGRLTAAFGTAGRRVGALAMAAIALLVIYLLLAQWAVYSTKPAFKVASWLTLTFRKPVKPASMQSIFNVALWLIRWMAVPALALPMLSRIATRGWRGAAPRAGRVVYWIEVPALLVCGLWLPLKLMGWAPDVGGFGLQVFSFVLRLGAAYLLFVSAGLTIDLVTARSSAGVPVAH